jgi:hypothetical protein
MEYEVSRRSLPATLSAVACLLLVSSGCSPMRFSQYSGSRTFWPVSQESMAETSFALPVYRDWPDKRFEIVGSLRFQDPRKDWDDGVINAAVSAAKHQGGDAIIIRHGAEFGVSANIGSVDDSMVWSQNQTSALVIKWKPIAAVEAEAKAKRAFRENFRTDHPDLSKNSALLDLAIEYVQWTGLAIDSEAASSKLKELLAETHEGAEGELSGKWLYKCNFKKSSLTASHTDFFFGIGLVNLKDNVLTMVSTSGSEVNFSGNCDKGRVDGKMGIGSISINSDGVASKEKISLSGQGQISDGMFQASLIFLR